MHPVLFKLGSITVYSYGFMIAIGVVCAVLYLYYQGRKDVNLTFDQANSLFLYLFIAAVIGGKLFMIFEDPGYYLGHISRLVSGSGFVFYGSFLFAVPTMFWYFRRNKLPTYRMLDIMAVTTCLVHGFGRIGCFMAGCCYGTATYSFLGVVFSDPVCKAPLGTSLHPVQLYESGFIFLLGASLVLIKQSRQKFYGQLFLIYLASYAIGRSVLETFRGDEARGYVIGHVVSTSQFVAFLVLVGVIIVYGRWSSSNKIPKDRQPG